MTGLTEAQRSLLRELSTVERLEVFGRDVASARGLVVRGLARPIMPPGLYVITEAGRREIRSERTG